MTYGLRLIAFFSLVALAAGISSPGKFRARQYSKTALTKKSGHVTLADDDSGDDDDDDDNRATV
jgi:hypothetical protein